MPNQQPPAAKKIGLGPALRKWWLTSVPYLFVFACLVLLLRPSPGVLAHVLLPFLLAFWLALYSSLGWLVVALGVAVRRWIYYVDVAMVLMAAAASALGVYLEFFWKGNLD